LSLWWASIRWTVCGEIASTTPSYTNCRANAALSPCDSDRPTTSGRAHASLTTYNATAGGKNGLTARAFFVRQSIEALRHEAQGPVASMAFS